VLCRTDSRATKRDHGGVSATTAVLLSPYSPLWPAIFDVEARNLERLLDGAVRIEHIGSTAVPGLGAKPVIDVMLGAPDLAFIDARIPRLTAHGYRYVPEFERAMPQRRYFTRSDGQPGNFHVHAVALESPFWRSHLAFRDMLRAKPALAADYWKLKQRLAARFPDDRAAYTDGKGAFIREVLQGAS
jgi:GrpB-like predicted nucleotidyltransferase (UPF0157 family)